MNTEIVIHRFAERLRARRVTLGLTQLELAEEAGIAQPKISFLESGNRSPTLATMQKLAASLGVTPSYFIREKL
jgi:transcriptional regulator with XRE-family HTH domain